MRVPGRTRGSSVQGLILERHEKKTDTVFVVRQTPQGVSKGETKGFEERVLRKGGNGRREVCLLRVRGGGSTVCEM